MTTHKVSIPGRFAEDWAETAQGYAADIQDGKLTGEGAAAYMELWQALIDTPHTKQGRGMRQVVHLSRPTVKWLRSEATIRYMHHDPKTNKLEHDAVARYAANRVKKACDAILNEAGLKAVPDA